MTDSDYEDTRVFVVTMHRYGDPEKHSYVLGVFTDILKAKEYGKVEEDYRSRKYKANIIECRLDELLVSYERLE